MTVPTAVQSGLADQPATITLAMLGDDLPVRLLATDQVPTALAWLERLERSWSEVVAVVNEPTARVWRLRMVGGALTFEERPMRGGSNHRGTAQSGRSQRR